MFIYLFFCYNDKFTNSSIIIVVFLSTMMNLKDALYMEDHSVKIVQIPMTKGMELMWPELLVAKPSELQIK